MNWTIFRQSVRWATVVVHIIIAIALVLMTLPSFGNVARQVTSGYIPPDYWLLSVLMLIAIGLGIAVAVGLVRWLRGSRRTLIGVDIAVVTFSWSFLVLFVVSNDLPIVTWVLSPVALMLAWRAPRRTTVDAMPQRGC